MIRLLNTTCSCTLKTGLTSGNFPLLLFQSGFLVTEAGGHQGVSKLGELTKIDSFHLHQPGKKTALNMREVIPIFAATTCAANPVLSQVLVESPVHGVKQFQESLCYRLKETRRQIVVSGLHGRGCNLKNTCSSCMYKPCRAVVLWVLFSVIFKRLQTLFLSPVEYNEEMIIRHMEKDTERSHTSLILYIRI